LQTYLDLTNLCFILKFRPKRFHKIDSRSQRSTADDDDILTPYIKLKDTPSRSAWDEEENATPGKFSSWDAATPESSRRDRVSNF
jgi:hypothetical protein